jgi:hypothetical protein
VSQKRIFNKAIVFSAEGTSICRVPDGNHFAAPQARWKNLSNLEFAVRELTPLKLNLRTSPAQGPPAPIRLAFWFAVLALLGIWPALTNGQPFFYADTTAYVRGADLAISKALGRRFATDWSKDQRRAIETQTSATGSEPAAPEQKPAQRVVLAGRSIIYGALLYMGALTGGMWFAIIVQSLIAVYLVFLFTVRILRLDFRYFLVSCGVLLLASPLPFCVSHLMPDVFAGFLILGVAILATGWDRLSKTERAITSAVLLFAVLSHTTHVILLIGLTVLTATYVGLADRSQWVRIRGLVGIGVACALTALLWEVAFSLGVSRALGTPPVRPPFVTAKLVSILGESAVSQACASNEFAVCKFLDRFPVGSYSCDSFLWSEDKRTGVFNVADRQTKQVLSEEQMRFAMAIIPANLPRFASGVFHDALRQLTLFGLGEYWYNANALSFFKSRLPSQDFERMTSTLAARSRSYVVFGSTVLYLTAVLSLIVIVVLLSGPLSPTSVASEGGTEQKNVWRAATYVLLAGILLNAIICGGLSDVNNRYEARVIWLIQFSLIAGLCVTRAHLKVSSKNNIAVFES